MAVREKYSLPYDSSLALFEIKMYESLSVSVNFLQKTKAKLICSLGIIFSTFNDAHRKRK